MRAGDQAFGRSAAADGASFAMSAPIARLGFRQRIEAAANHQASEHHAAADSEASR
ncbi:hypothetical protein Caci_1544 [Catenulispora acidiphila DSM 44928]|uniref:Uncharacterized protein n=1 Tax=Catenulispora acidiphila (strain DSM 44928 / JCM 14897 / NBRC 102108 / NRRL B-24433 / ID139908) TaxID=479433 RepID=C7QA67_CATAD|nr:hypothetical protein Caci_1544 [Catenulispora acidiphila DSM 44928]